uniref:Uncharacterized protein n=1 Tax=Cacopsylla melanoneura TaxID=428564 RepID=A0A8D9EU55_9HEMI
MLIISRKYTSIQVQTPIVRYHFGREIVNRNLCAMVGSGSIVTFVRKRCNSKKVQKVWNFIFSNTSLPITRSSVVIENMNITASTRITFRVIQSLGFVRYVVKLAPVWFYCRTI